MKKLWPAVLVEAAKVLGKDAEIPPLKPSPAKLWEGYFKAADNVGKAARELGDVIQEMEDNLSTYSNAMKQNAAFFERADFGLDEKSKEDAKKINQAQKIFSDYFADRQTEVDKNTKILDELDKHVVQLSKYKPSLDLSLA